MLGRGIEKPVPSTGFRFDGIAQYRKIETTSSKPASAINTNEIICHWNRSLSADEGIGGVGTISANVVFAVVLSVVVDVDGSMVIVFVLGGQFGGVHLEI